MQRKQGEKGNEAVLSSKLGENKGPITSSGLAWLIEMKVFTRDPEVNRSYNVLHKFDYMASGLARLAEVLSVAHRVSSAKRAGRGVFFSCNPFNTRLARQTGLRNLQRVRFMT